MPLAKNSAQTLIKIDPSRHIVYQMLGDIKDVLQIKIIQKETADWFLFKTEPFIDSLYNYAHLLSDNFTAADLNLIDDFFDCAAYRIKTPAAENITDILSAQGFKLKNTTYAMTAADLNSRDYDFILPAGLKIIHSDNFDNFDNPGGAAFSKNILNDIKSVFVDAYDYSAEDYDRKFGFLDQFKKNNQNKQIKSFVLYENDRPVSTGSYYAYDKFSIENIGTIKSARGRGYANLIMRALLQEAKELGYNEACLVASEAALAVYQKLGFEEIAKNNTYLK